MGNTDDKPENEIFSRTIRSLLVDNILNFINVTNIDEKKKHITKRVADLMLNESLSLANKLTSQDDPEAASKSDDDKKHFLKEIVIDQGSAYKISFKYSQCL